MRVRNIIKVRTVVTKEGKAEKTAGSVQRVCNDATNVSSSRVVDGKRFRNYTMLM